MAQSFDEKNLPKLPTGIIQGGEGVSAAQMPSPTYASNLMGLSQQIQQIGQQLTPEAQTLRKQQLQAQFEQENPMQEQTMLQKVVPIIMGAGIGLMRSRQMPWESAGSNVVMGSLAGASGASAARKEYIDERKKENEKYIKDRFGDIEKESKALYNTAKTIETLLPLQYLQENPQLAKDLMGSGKKLITSNIMKGLLGNQESISDFETRVKPDAEKRLNNLLMKSKQGQITDKEYQKNYKLLLDNILEHKKTGKSALWGEPKRDN